MEQIVDLKGNLENKLQAENQINKLVLLFGLWNPFPDAESEIFIFFAHLACNDLHTHSYTLHFTHSYQTNLYCLINISLV